MKNKMRTYLSLGLSILALSATTVSCSEYTKVLSSTDANYKMAMANKYYEQGDCDKSTVLYDELLKLYKGTTKAERLYFALASSHYCQHDFLIAAYYFGNFEKRYAKSDKKIEASYMVGKCYQALSPNSDLNQEHTNQAIAHFTNFLQKYPNSEYDEEVRAILKELNDKLTLKEANISLLYLKTEKYKPAIRSINLFLQKYPESKFVEKMKYNLVKAHYDLAIRSVEEKKESRLKNVIIVFQDMKNSFPESSHLSELNKIVGKVRELQKAYK
ncbi:MAG: outer membrane protein assembly factor BamD [Flavobacteriales bacterium]